MEIKKIVTCGSVDDGKSTLIGRIIFETKNILIDQEEKLKKLSARYGTTKKKLDFAVLIAVIKLMKIRFSSVNILFLDEIFSSVDPDGVHSILNTLRKLSDDLGNFRSSLVVLLGQ